MTVTGRMLTAAERVDLAQCLLMRALPCGCRVGLYRTWSSRVLAIVDDPHDDCRDRAHQADFVIADQAVRRSDGEAA